MFSPGNNLSDCLSFEDTSTEIISEPILNDKWKYNGFSLSLSSDSSVGRFKMATNVKAAVKPFLEMPGPRSYPIFGTLGSYFVSKKYSFDRLHWNGRKKFEEFGPVVREEIVPGKLSFFIFSHLKLFLDLTLKNQCFDKTTAPSFGNFSDMTKLAHFAKCIF